MKVSTNFSPAPSENDFNELLRKTFPLPIPLYNALILGYTFIRRNYTLYSIMYCDGNNVRIRELNTANTEALPRNSTCFVYHRLKQSKTDEVISEYIKGTFTQ